MNNQFDELTKSMAQAVTRRAALKKFGVGLAGMALACFGLTNTAQAGRSKRCATDADCNKTGEVCCNGYCNGLAYGSIPGNECACFWDKQSHSCASKVSPCDPIGGYGTCQNQCYFTPSACHM